MCRAGSKQVIVLLRVYRVCVCVWRAEDVKGVQGEAQDLQDTPSGPDALDRQGEPVPIVPGGFDDEENYPGQGRD
jgi:hypothetical protein